jgi:hypothetical protein
MQTAYPIAASVETAVLVEVYVQILTGEFAVDLGSGLRWGEPTSSFCDQ